MPIAYETVQSGRTPTTIANPKSQAQEAISDTLETTEREGNGKQSFDMAPGPGHAPKNVEAELDRLDLQG